MKLFSSRQERSITQMGKIAKIMMEKETKYCNDVASDSQS